MDNLEEKNEETEHNPAQDNNEGLPENEGADATHEGELVDENAAEEEQVASAQLVEEEDAQLEEEIADDLAYEAEEESAEEHAQEPIVEETMAAPIAVATAVAGGGNKARGKQSKKAKNTPMGEEEEAEDLVGAAAPPKKKSGFQLFMEDINAGDWSMVYEANKKLIQRIGLGIVAVVAIVVVYRVFLKPNEQEAMEKGIVPAYLFDIDSTKQAELGLKTLVDDYSGTNEANLAHYRLGSIYLARGEYDKALDEIESFDANGSTILGPLKYGLIGDIYSQKKEYESAKKYYVKAADENSNEFTAPLFLFKAGLVSELKLNDATGALKLYKAVKEKYPSSSQGQAIDKYIGRAEAMASATK